MSTPVLSPVEQDEVSRFGIHDLDVLAEMEERADDVPPCSRAACDRPAEVFLAMRCCGTGWLMCEPHLRRLRAGATEFLKAAKRPVCTCCGQKLDGLGFEDVYRVVTL